MKTKDFRSLSPQAQQELRSKAVRAVLAGRTRKEVADLFGLTRESVGHWVKRYRQDGAKALRARQRGRPKGGSLKAWQAAQIAKAVVDRPPEQLKLPFCLWTREAVGQLIERRFRIRLSVWTVGRYLARWGFTPQKPMRRAFEQDSQAVLQWLEEEYPLIRKKAKREKALIYWGDEMGLRSDHAVGRSYGRRGETPVVFGTGKRFGCNMISAITNRGQLNFMVFKQRFRTPVFLNFLKRLVRQAKRKVYLVLDKHPVHLARKVSAWIKKNRHRICIFFLPSYSPELNPDEILNQDVKSNSVGRRRARNQKELLANVRGYLWSRQHQPYIVQNYFNERHVQYAAV